MSRVAASAGARSAAGTVGLVVVLAAAGLPGGLGGGGDCADNDGDDNRACPADYCVEFY